jgi:GNAT superfamily N-acetyltransferase
MLRPARPADGPAIAEIYHRSFHETLPHIQLAHTDDEVREHFATVVTNDRGTWVAVEAGVVVGFLALNGDHVDHLYLLPEMTGQGIGSELIGLAQRERPAGLRLYAFQANTGACRFYEQHGFTVIDVDDTGTRNEEGEPDVYYGWPPLPAS